MYDFILDTIFFFIFLKKPVYFCRFSGGHSKNLHLSITTPTEEFSIMDVFQSKPPPSKKRKALVQKRAEWRRNVPGEHAWGLEESLEESLDLRDSFVGPATSKGSQSSRGSQGSRAWNCYLCMKGRSAQPRARCACKKMVHKVCKVNGVCPSQK